MNIRVVRMAVCHDDMPMQMAVLAISVPVKCMLMLVVLIMAVFVGMLHFFVKVLMAMLLGQVQPHPQCH